MKKNPPRARRQASVVLAGLLFLAAPGASTSSAQAQAAPEADPAAALGEALARACRQEDTQFALYLTSANAAVFRTLPVKQRTALMKRFVLLDAPGRPLFSNDAQGHTLVQCEAPGVTVELRFGDTRLEENLAFLPVELHVPNEPPGAPQGTGAARRVQFGLVREGGKWKLLSVGLLLLDLTSLAQQWEQAELAAGEEEAIAALHKLADSLTTYRRAFGKLPDSLGQLGPAPKEGISPEAAGLVDAELAAGSKGGYVFRYRIVPPAGEGAPSAFELAATPAEYGKAGRRSFFLDASGTLRGSDKHGAVAAASDPRIQPR